MKEAAQRMRDDRKKNRLIDRAQADDGWDGVGFGFVVRGEG